jgi:hypothetical protein
VCGTVLKGQRAALTRAGIVESVSPPTFFPWTVHTSNNASGIVFKVQDIRAREKAPYSWLHRSRRRLLIDKLYAEDHRQQTASGSQKGRFVTLPNSPAKAFILIMN